MKLSNHKSNAVQTELPSFPIYINSKRQGRHTEQKLCKKSNMDLPISKSNLLSSTNKSKALLTELLGLTF